MKGVTLTKLFLMSVPNIHLKYLPFYMYEYVPKYFTLCGFIHFFDVTNIDNQQKYFFFYLKHRSTSACLIKFH